jgi:thymidylate synthase (FAD)
MQVKLISYSQPPKDSLHEFQDIKDLVSFCARVSNPSNQLNTETTEKLINYLLKHKHFSPFEMVNICLEIETTRDISRQILRHVSFRFQEFSQRYADPVKELQFEIREARLQDIKNRQNSISVSDETLKEAWKIRQQRVIDAAKQEYEWAIQHGIAKECARVVLPEGNIITRMYMNGSLRSWIHYIDVRSGNGTQLEHMLIARECATAISEVFSMITDFVQG